MRGAIGWQNCFPRTGGPRRELPFADRPTSRERCDLLVAKAEDRIWIEVKGAWKQYAADDLRPGNRNSAFVKHLHAAAHDIDKLTPLLGPHATVVGLVLVGFDTEDDPVTASHLEIPTGHLAGWAAL
jgi:hypothetical protein